MRSSLPTAPWGTVFFILLSLLLAAYFTFAAVQGDYGIFRRAEIQAETDALHAQLDTLTKEVKRMENLTHRLSDSYLDLDLLDEQARDILGLMRPDEIIVR